jgi:hypothetical protein
LIPLRTSGTSTFVSGEAQLKVFEHLRKPHGIAAAAMMMFLMGWAIWTFIIW